MVSRDDWDDEPQTGRERGLNGTRQVRQGEPAPPDGGGRHMGRRFVLGALMVTGAAAVGTVALDVAAKRHAAADGGGREAALSASRQQAARAAGRHPHLSGSAIQPTTQPHAHQTTQPHPHQTTQTTQPTTQPTAHPAQHPAQHPTPHPSEHHQHQQGPPPQQPTYYVEDGPNVIALTIDDGPNPEYTPQILQILERYRVKATFSMIGQSVVLYPSIAREVAAAGHLIVNHTWSHADLPTLSSHRLRDEVTRAEDAIHSVTGRQPTMLRAPYGAWSPQVLEYLAERRLTPLDWSVDPQDWARPGVGTIVRTILRTTRSGSIILEHDGGGDRSQTVAALKIVLPKLLDEGFRFALV